MTITTGNTELLGAEFITLNKYVPLDIKPNLTLKQFSISVNKSVGNGILTVLLLYVPQFIFDSLSDLIETIGKEVINYIDNI